MVVGAMSGLFARAGDALFFVAAVCSLKWLANFMAHQKEKPCKTLIQNHHTTDRSGFLGGVCRGESSSALAAWTLLINKRAFKWVVSTVITKRKKSCFLRRDWEFGSQSQWFENCSLPFSLNNNAKKKCNINVCTQYHTITCHRYELAVSIGNHKQSAARWHYPGCVTNGETATFETNSFRGLSMARNLTASRFSGHH